MRQCNPFLFSEPSLFLDSLQVCACTHSGTYTHPRLLVFLHIKRKQRESSSSYIMQIVSDVLEQTRVTGDVLTVGSLSRNKTPTGKKSWKCSSTIWRKTQAKNGKSAYCYTFGTGYVNIFSSSPIGSSVVAGTVEVGAVLRVTQSCCCSFLLFFFLPQCAALRCTSGHSHSSKLQLTSSSICLLGMGIMTGFWVWSLFVVSVKKNQNKTKIGRAAEKHVSAIIVTTQRRDGL